MKPISRLFRNRRRSDLNPLHLWVGWAIALAVLPAFAQSTPGKPNLNGVWQVLNTANFDLDAHAARAAMALREGPYGPVPAKEVLALGAVGAVPAGLGVVEGGRIPYKPAALARKP